MNFQGDTMTSLATPAISDAHELDAQAIKRQRLLNRCHKNLRRDVGKAIAD